MDLVGHAGKSGEISVPQKPVSPANARRPPVGPSPREGPELSRGHLLADLRAIPLCREPGKALSMKKSQPVTSRVARN